MLRKLAFVVRFVVGIALALATSGLSTRAHEFSADIVETGAGATSNPRAGKIYVQNEKVRIAVQDLPDGFFLVDAAQPSAYFVRPRQKLFMDAKQTSLLTQLLVPLDPNDPCRQWQTMAVEAGAIGGGGGRWTCTQSVKDSIDGHDVLIYRADSPMHRLNSIWIDPQLKFPLEVQFDDGTTVALKNLREGPQDGSLFDLPATFRKFDPQMLIDRIKQSDVWVEPPK